MLKTLSRYSSVGSNQFKKTKFTNDNNKFKPIISTLTKTTMTIKNKRISIPVTDLPALCGNMDHYNNWPKAICRIWKQIWPLDFQNIKTNLDNAGYATALCSNQKKLYALQKRTGTKVNATTAVNNINKRQVSTATSLVEKQTVIANDINKCTKLSDNDKKEMTRLVNSATNVVYGSRNENRGLDIFKQYTGLDIVNTQLKLIHTLYQESLPDYLGQGPTNIEWVITGKIDGLSSDGSIIEIKNRQKGLFNKLRDYEECQIQCYLNFNSSNKGYLVEVYASNTDKTHISNSIIECSRDNTYLERVIYPDLHNVKKLIMALPNLDTETKQNLCSGNINNINQITF